MALKHLLIHLDDGRGAAERFDVAARLARAHDAHLTGLYVRMQRDERPMYSVSSAELAEQLRRTIQTQNERVEQEEAAVRDRFVETARAAGVSASHHTENAIDGGGPVSNLVRYARTADLAVVGKPEAGDGTRNMPHDLLFSAGVPIIVVPPRPPSSAASRVVIAWNGSREAARAVKDALPILEKADKVIVLCVDQQDRGSNVSPAQHLGEHLEHHGIRIEQDNIVRAGQSVHDVIISRLADHGADMLVMGAWGHSRLREFVLGGVTRRILDHAPVPVLMSH